MEKWRGCVAVVTGANSGIGFSVLNELSSNGIRVVGFDINVDAIEKLKAEKKSTEIYAVVCDVTKDEPTEKAFKWVEEKLGGCDILINNAGMIRATGVFEYKKPMQEVELNINLNFTAVVRCSRLAFMSMEKRGSYGFIININSVCGHSVMELKGDSTGVYHGTKYAITATANIMRTELNRLQNRKVRVSNISPGVIKTTLFDHANISKDVQKELFKNPVLLPKNISDTVNYLLSTPYEINITELLIRATGADL